MNHAPIGKPLTGGLLTQCQSVHPRQVPLTRPPVRCDPRCQMHGSHRPGLAHGTPRRSGSSIELNHSFRHEVRLLQLG